jgi:lipoprotein-anchoring transpeptidase ErfK/SrfK
MMKGFRQIAIILCVSAALLNLCGCATNVEDAATSMPAPTTTPTVTPTIATTPTVTPSPAAFSKTPVTLPLIDAFFFSDEQFATDLKRDLQLTDEQVTKLRTVARSETARLREGSEQDYQGSTLAAATLARQQISEIVGPEKTERVSDAVLRRWQEGGEATATPITSQPSPSPIASSVVAARTPSASTSRTPSPSTPTARTPSPSNTSPFVPPDTRVIINAPAYRMDVFENGQLIKSYKVGIGYPEFPLPTGERRATTIVFNPPWTPPDEPWVESSNKIKVGEKIDAGSRLNPLGFIKIPIGLPSLIHGGKAPAKLGGFASHGCVGLTDKQAEDFAKTLANLGGVELTDQEINKYRKNRAETQTVKLRKAIPVELHYETISVEDGRLHIYRDVYEHGTNTEENLRAVLANYGVTLEQLSEAERTRILLALKQMSRDAIGTPVTDANEAKREDRKQRNIERGTLTRAVKGQKEVVIEMAALAGKGYPAPIAMNIGSDRPQRRRGR